MTEVYSFSQPETEKGERIPVVDVCVLNGVESGIPEKERGVLFMEKDKTTMLYIESLMDDTALPVLVGMPHSGEYVPQDIIERTSDHKAFVDGLDAGTAYIFSPQKGEQYVAVRNRISRLVADPNRGSRQFRSAEGVGGVTWTTNLQEHPIYKHGQEPTDEEMAQNVDNFYTPYYRGLHSLVASLHETMGYRKVLVLDAHSFPGTVDVPKIGLVGNEKKPLFILGSQGNTKASEEVMRMVVDALARFAPSREEYPGIYEHISETIQTPSEYGWGGARNVQYFGHPEGIVAQGIGEGLQADFKVHAIQIEMNMSAFFEDGQYNTRHLEAVRETLQKTIDEVGRKLKEVQK